MSTRRVCFSQWVVWGPFAAGQAPGKTVAAEWSILCSEFPAGSLASWQGWMEGWMDGRMDVEWQL